MKSSNQNNYLIQTSNGQLWYFFYYDKSINYKLYDNNNWIKETEVIKDISSNFSVSLTEDDEIYIFCQDLAGNVLLCLYESNKWSIKKILENQTNEIYDISFQMLFSNQSLNLIYSMPIAGEKHAQLVYQSRDNIKWESPQILDNIIPFKNVPFIIQKLNNSLCVAFYERKSRDSTLGYREFSISKRKWGSFNPFHSTIYTYTDQSFLTTEDTIHVLYVVKTGFSYQLIYKNKTDSEWNKQMLIYENNRIEMCSLFIVNTELWLVWYSNSQLYTCVSYNNGKTFTKSNRYQSKYGNLPLKAFFATNLKQKEESLYIREILLYDKATPELMFIPELYPDFYKLPAHNRPSNQINEAHNLDSLNENINILKNKISLYEQQLAEKDLQIAALIKEKNVLTQTKQILENQIANQSLELSSLQNQIEALTNLQTDKAALNEINENDEVKNENI